MFYLLNRYIVYKQILSTLFSGDSNQACERILTLYNKNGFCIIDYLYFANIAGKKVFDSYIHDYEINEFRDALLSDYKTLSTQRIYKAYQQSILDADVVLPDGIALQLFYFLDQKKWLNNLNWTDFCPYFLSYIKQHHPDKDIYIVLYGTYSHLLEQTKHFLLKQWYSVVYAQDGYSNLDWNNVDLALKEKKGITILLVARSTPDYPIQEIRSFANKQNIEKHTMIVMNQWGTFDFWVGAQKRAPKAIRYIKMERLRRLISDPKRNIKKVVSTLALFRYVFSYLILKKV